MKSISLFNRKRLAYVLAASMFVACDGTHRGDDQPGDDQPGGGSDEGTDAGPMADPAGPVFLSFGTNVQQLTEDQSIVFSAVLTDPDGIDDLIGGTLTDASGAIQYGSFATSGQEGSYTTTLTWDAMHQSEDITFRQQEGRTFKAVFFDVAGHRVERTIAITLTCLGAYACHGTCANACGVTSAIRGSCDATCQTDPGMTCTALGTHQAFYGMYQDHENFSSCTVVPPASLIADSQEQASQFAYVKCVCLPLL